MLLLPVVLFVGGGTSLRRGEPLEVLGKVPAFELVERSGRTVRAEDLRGRTWIADFVFTSCPGPCPLLTSKMAALQEQLAGSEVQLVTVSVDPVTDTPEVLRSYAERHRADPERWLFLTGPVDAVRGLIRDGFKLAVAESPGDAAGPITHSTRFVLVDRDLQIRRYVPTEEPGAMDELVESALDLERAAGSR